MHNEKLFNLIQSRTSNAKVDESIQLSLLLQSVQKVFQVLQDAKDKIGSGTNSDQQSK